MNKQEEVKFTQSGFLKIDGKKRVSVRFERGSDIAEGMLPPGKITKNHGFSDKEVAGLEIYLEMNCDEIYKKAKEIGKFTNLLPLLFAWMILLTTCAGSQSDVLRMKSTEKASGQTMLSGERLAKTYDALLETARGRSETLESGRAKEFASVNWRRMAGVTIRILLVILPALILQFWSIWYRRADEIVPRGLLLVKFVRRADGKKNGILALMK